MKSKADISKSIVFLGRITIFVFSVKVFLHPDERIVDCRSSGSEEIEINLSSCESVDTVDSVDCLLNKVSRLGLASVPWDNFLRLRALNPTSSRMSYFSKPPHSAADGKTIELVTASTTKPGEPD